MQWITCRYACDLRRRTHTLGEGHVFQRRFWSAPVEGRLRFLTVLRYIEANPVRAGLVESADAWQWSSLADRTKLCRQFLAPLPTDLPEDWLAIVNLVQSNPVLQRIRETLVRKGRPPRKAS